MEGNGTVSRPELGLDGKDLPLERRIDSQTLTMFVCTEAAEHGSEQRNGSAGETKLEDMRTF